MVCAKARRGSKSCYIRAIRESRTEAGKEYKKHAFRTTKGTFWRAVASVFMETTDVFILPP